MLQVMIWGYFVGCNDIELEYCDMDDDPCQKLWHVNVI